MTRPTMKAERDLDELSKLRRSLDALAEPARVSAHLDHDPLGLVRGCEPQDQEVAAVVASTFAFGKVDLFLPVLRTLFERAAARGGWSTWVGSLDRADERFLRPLYYRWLRGADLTRLFRAAASVREVHGSLEAAFCASDDPESSTVRAGLDGLVSRLREACASDGEGPVASRGLQFALSSPSGGSACKRWNMALRWLCRPADGVDLGLWKVSPSRLVMPLDTHIHRVAGFLGLTRRKATDWRTAEEVTAGLRALDPQDPVRFDFTLAHLGISGACKGRYVAGTCEACPLWAVCRQTRACRLR